VTAADRPASAISTAHAGLARIVAPAQDMTADAAPGAIVVAALRGGGGLKIVFNNASEVASALGDITSDAQWDSATHSGGVTPTSTST